MGRGQRPEPFKGPSVNPTVSECITDDAQLRLTSGFFSVKLTCLQQSFQNRIDFAVNSSFFSYLIFLEYKWERCVVHQAARVGVQ